MTALQDLISRTQTGAAPTREEEKPENVGVFERVKSGAKRAFDFIKPLLRPGIPEVIPPKVVGGMAREIVRSGASTGLTLAGKSELKIDPTASRLEQLIQRTLVGSEPVKSVADRVAEAELKLPTGEALPFGIKAPKELAFPGIVALTAMDFLPGGSARKSAVQALAKADKAEEVLSVLARMKVPAKRAEALVEPLRLAKTADEVEALLKGGVKGQALERKFITSAREVVPDASKLHGQYIPRSTDELAIKAKNLIAEYPEEAERMALTGSDENAVAVASELLKKYADDAAKTTDETVRAALYDKAAEVANTLAPKLTEQGRAIQAASILGRLTPEGQVRFAAKQILRFNEMNPGRKIPNLTGEQAQFILDEMKAINKMADGMERATRFKKLQDYVSDLTPTPLMRKITAVWKAGLLTGIKTTGLNLFSNLSHATSEVVKDVPAAIVDSVASLFTGRRAKTFTVRGVPKGIQDGFQRGYTYLRTGFDERNVSAKLDYKRVNFGNGAVAKAFQAYTDAVFRVMGASDQPFYYGALSRSLMDQALADGINQGLKGRALKEYATQLIKNPTEEMLKYAVADASTAVFQNETYLGKAAKALQNVPVIGEIVVPFGRTPSAVATQILKYTPAGTVAEIVGQIRKGQFDQRLFSEAVGRGITGIGALYLGYELAKKGLVALDRPVGEREQKLWELEGRKPNSIKINGKWRSPIVFGPAGNLLLIGGHFKRALDESGSPTEALSKAVFGSAKSFSEQTFLTGINRAVEALTDPERSAQAYFDSLVASVVPTIVSDISRAMDPFERRAESTIEKVRARIPVAREGLEPQVDVLGRERESIGNPLEILIDPTRPSKDITNPVVSELRRLTSAGFSVSPTLLGDKKGFAGLTKNQNTTLWKNAGSIANDKLDALFKNEEYRRLADDDKAKVVESFIEKAKLYARVGMLIEITDGLGGDDLRKKLSEAKASGLMTSDVFRAYSELR